ncbi:RhoGAP-domain-containing protein [Ramaria rubella]|nr:RhoGAP-domain-containing protein [Ramaria rubella]
MSGQFVRALNSVYHLDCFRCRDCNSVVAQKFFPIEGHDGKQHPLCERDYFKRLNLICGSCGMALRASYITACGKKFHVEHFTCSVCPTLFGPQDSYYEHEGNVYCHFHYSTRFATKCVGCGSAILKQFVEINRNMRDECWHPECYMIHKFWSVKLANRRAPEIGDGSQPAYVYEEQQETAESLKDKQLKMEKQVYRIWTVLSAFEESSAACISDMLQHVSNGHYLEAIRMAEKFILHVEVLFATIDDLETHFARLTPKGMSHLREARMLCRKTVDLFTLLSHTQETGERRIGMTQELLALVTGLAHYLKILIRIALTGALKLEREYDFNCALVDFLDHLQALATNRGNPAARRLKADTNVGRSGGSLGTQGVSYGYKSLAPENAGETPFAPQALDGAGKAISPPSDLCLECKQTVEEDCVRLGTYRRWHSACIKCKTCGRAAAAAPLPPKEPQLPKEDEDKDKDKPPTKLSTVRRAPANVDDFVFEPAPLKEGSTTTELAVAFIFCVDHGHAGCEHGFRAVSRLEQYAFLLNVALRRLYLLLKRRGVMPMSAAAAATPGTEREGPVHDAYRDSSDIMRMSSSVALDRKLSATARLPKRSTIVESPSGRAVQPTDILHSQRPQDLANHKQQNQQPILYNTPATPTTPTLRQPQPRNAGTTPLLQAQGRGQGQPPNPRPPNTRNNTQVYIVDEQSVPTSPSQEDSPRIIGRADGGLTLADIPQLMEVEQARAQRRSLPRQGGKPLIAELSPLELAIIKHASVLALSRSSLKDQFDLEEILDMVEVKKSGFWGKLFKGGNDKKNVKKKGGVFGVPLEQLVERQGADSILGVSREPLRVPSFIDDVVSAMRQMDLSVEGIFRKNGNIRRLKELTDAIDRDPQSVDLTQDNAVQLAALLKKFLRDLPDPLLTVKLHRLFVASQMLPSEADRKRYLHYISIILPRPNRDTMEVLFVFLKWVASFAHVDEETGSKMDLQNLATVICPSILWGKSRDVAHSESVMAIPVVTELLINQDEFWQVPDEFMPILHDQEYFISCMELPSKDFVKKCDTYMRMRANGRQPMSGAGLTSPVGHNGSGSLGPPVSRSDGPDVRLIPQRSEPAIPRGRPMAPSDPARPNANRYKQSESQSLERSTNNTPRTIDQWQQGQGSPSKPTALHAGLNVHQPFAQSPPQALKSASSPPMQQPPQQSMNVASGRPPLSDADWAASQRPPPNVLGQGGWSSSRPSSFRRASEDNSPTPNGRHSPSQRAQ